MYDVAAPSYGVRIGGYAIERHRAALQTYPASTYPRSAAPAPSSLGLKRLSTVCASAAAQPAAPCAARPGLCWYALGGFPKARPTIWPLQRPNSQGKANAIALTSRIIVRHQCSPIRHIGLALGGNLYTLEVDLLSAVGHL